MNNTTGVPCYGCVEPKRHEGCHSRCEEYLAWVAKREQIKARKAETITLENAIHDVHAAGYRKTTKYRNKK